MGEIERTNDFENKKPIGKTFDDSGNIIWYEWLHTTTRFLRIRIPVNLGYLRPSAALRVWIDVLMGMENIKPT